MRTGEEQIKLFNVKRFCINKYYYLSINRKKASFVFTNVSKENFVFNSSENFLFLFLNFNKTSWISSQLLNHSLGE